MANHLALATVTEALRLRLDAAIKPELPGVQVVSKRPDNSDGQTQGLVTVFLYRITPNAALRNSDLPTRRSDGTSVVRRPAVALDLHYLLSFGGEEQELVPQRMLGLAVSSLHSAPVLTRDELEDASESETWLNASNLKDDIELVKFGVASMSLDELSKLWSVFVQIPYRLSAPYDASVVLIESDEHVREPLPVRRRGVDAIPVRQPVVENVNAGRPVVGGDGFELVIAGRWLRGPATYVSFDGGDRHQVVPASDTRIVVPAAVASTLGAGVHGVQVIHELLIGDPPSPHRALESNVVPFVLRPRIAVAPGHGSIDVGFEPAVRADQRVRLLLNELLDPPPADRDLHFATVESTSDGSTGPWATLTFATTGIPSGTYLVRAQVDGAESLLDIDGGGPSTPTVALP